MTMSAIDGLAKVGEVKTAKQARILIDEAKRVEQLLRAVDELHDNLVKLIDHEIAVYTAIRDSGLAHKVTGVSARYACEQFCNLDEHGIGVLREQCICEGMTVRGNFERDRIAKRENDKLKAVIVQADESVEAFRRNGIVNISGVSSTSRDRDVAFLIDAAKDRLKDRLLCAGAVGIGDGVYVDPIKYRKDAWQALIKRLQSIGNDINAACRLYSLLVDRPDEDQMTYLDSICFKGFCARAEAMCGR